MKNYLAVFIGTEAAAAKWEALDEKTRAEREKAGLAAWHGWVDKNKKSLIEVGSPVGGTKKIAPNGISDFSNQICGFTVVRAESHEAAAKLFLNHPHFTHFPGDSIEVMECLEIPGM